MQPAGCAPTAHNAAVAVLNRGVCVNLTCGCLLCVLCQVFGHKLDSPRTIMERLGYLEGPAPGGDAPLPSFVRENKSGAKGVAWTPPVDSPAVAR